MGQTNRMPAEAPKFPSANYESVNVKLEESTVIPVVRDADFRRFRPHQFSVWGSPTIDGMEFRILLHAVEVREVAHLAKPNEEGQLFPTNKQTILEVHELAEITVGVAAARQLIVELQNLLSTYDAQ
jgi:hypothetical protein